MKPSYTPPIRLIGVLLGLIAGIVPVASATGLNVKDYGARGDGRTDDYNAIVRAITAAKNTPDHLLYFPAGTYRYSRVVKVDGVQIEGVSPTLTIFEATDNSRSAWELTGNAPGIRNVGIRTQTKPTKRATTPETAGVHVHDAANFLVDRVNITATASVGIMVRGSGGTSQEHARISNCVVKNTLADGIHMTSGSHYIDVDANQVSGTGDDMIAVVSYRTQPTAVHHINITRNVVADQTWGRGIAVVGGSDVKIAANTIRRSSAAGIYLASEVAYDTSGAWRVTVQGNLLDRCSIDSRSGHAAVMVFGRESAGGKDNRTGDIVIADNTIRDSRKDGIWCGRQAVNVSLLRNLIERSGDNGLRVGPSSIKVLMVGNTVNTTGSSGLAVMEDCDRISVLNTASLGGANSFSTCGQYGIWVNAGGGKGLCAIVGARFTAINQRRYGGIDAIKLQGPSSNYVATVTDNRLYYTSADRIDQVVDSDVPLELHARNSKMLEGFVPLYVD